MPTNLDPQLTIDDLIRDIDSFGGDALTEPLPATFHAHGTQLDPSGPTMSADDPSLRSDEAVNRIVKRIPLALTGKGGKEVPDLLEQFVMLCLWRAGYKTDLAKGKTSPHHAEALDAAGVTLLRVASRYGRVRAVLNAERLALLPKHLAVRRFRQQIFDVLRRALLCAERLVVDAEAEVDATVRPAVALLEPLASALPPLEDELTLLFALTRAPAEKAQATRAAYERGHEAGVEDGHEAGLKAGLDAASDASRAAGRSAAEAPPSGQPVPVAGKVGFALPPAVKGRPRPR